MPEKISVELGNVQKTLLLPLWGRAAETQKKEPLLIDKTAVDIVGKNLKGRYDLKTKITAFLSDALKMQYLVHLRL